MNKITTKISFYKVSSPGFRYFLMPHANVSTLCSKLMKNSYMKNIKLTAITKNLVKFDIKVEPDHLNLNKTLFGGITASLIDIGGKLI